MGILETVDKANLDECRLQFRNGGKLYLKHIGDFGVPFPLKISILYKGFELKGSPMIFSLKNQ
jgi:hypothetical protein